ncbi:MAG: zf-TFIIB domain-containing protein [Candidatus Eremiobacterota bacterium]
MPRGVVPWGRARVIEALCACCLLLDIVGGCLHACDGCRENCCPAEEESWAATRERTEPGAAAGVRPRVPRPPPRSCPACERDLDPRLVGPVEVDHCPRCHGLWLDRDELQALRRQANLPGWLLSGIVGQTPRVPEGQRQCPCCRRTLEVHYWRQVFFELCPACEGMWLDRGELNRLLEPG